MDKPIFFDHQLIKPSDLDFMSESYTKAIDENFTVFSNSAAGLVSGFNITGTVGSSQFSVYAGVAYNNAGERLQTYATSGVVISFTGTKNIYARLTSVSYDPNPATNPGGPSNITQSLNPDTNALVDTRSYSYTYIDSTGTSSDVVIGTVTADSLSKFVSSSSSGSQHLQIAGMIDVYDGTLDQSAFQIGTIDSDKFNNPLNYTINLNTGVGINLVGSGSNSIGSSTNPLANIYSNNATFHQINGMSPIIIDSLSMKPGASINPTSGPLIFDQNGLGTQFGGSIQTNEINVGLSGNILLYTPTGNITIQAVNGDVSVASDLIVGGDIQAAGGASFQDGLTVSGGITNFVGSTVVLNHASVDKNLIFNSDFSMGLPLYYTGTSVFNNPGNNIVNFKSGLTIFSPWDARYSGTLIPYAWNFSGTPGSVFKNGTSEVNSDAIGINEVQSLIFTPAPGTGTFQIQYTGIPALFWPSGTGIIATTSTLNYDSTNIQVQSALENLANIGSGNITVAGTMSGGFFLTFGNDLGFKNLPLISVVNNTLLTGVTTSVAIISTVTNGYTPVFNAMKDQSVYTDIPRLNHYALVSGNNVTSASGIYFSAPIANSKPDTTYNVSLYYKSLLSDSNINIGAAISDSTNPNAVVTTGSYVNFDKTNNFATWQRLSTTVVSPGITGNFQNLLFQVNSSGLTTNTAAIEIAGIQITEGADLFPYSSEDSVRFRMYDPTGFIASTGGWSAPVYDSANHLTYRNRGLATNEKVLLVSGSFYSPGGMASIIAQDTSSPGQHVYKTLLIDGTPVASSMNRDPGLWHADSVASTQYIQKGKHNVAYMWINGGSDGALCYINLSGNAWSPTSIEGMMITAPKIEVVFH
jgi:hypothetical protein